MVAVYVTVVALALAQQVTFSFLYWRWIPQWTKNPYGRMAQLGCWALIVPLLLSLINFAISGGGSGSNTIRLVFIIGFLPLLAFGFLQLDLLKKAVESGEAEPLSNPETTEESEANSDR